RRDDSLRQPGAPPAPCRSRLPRRPAGAPPGRPGARPVGGGGSRGAGGRRRGRGGGAGGRPRGPAGPGAGAGGGGAGRPGPGGRWVVRGAGATELDVSHEAAARRTRELAQANRELEALNDVALAVNKTLDLSGVLGIALERALRAGEIETGWVRLLSEDGRED